ncbi:MAG: UTP--glucose-1-phosphate uridylyltransferase GalU [Deltaproteobacteria bacterium]|jgi:UTP--glucose-1-phosphate uridylyltransferase|nr:UTP--glucose-1-phosphate uridylyltransferase GalU [Deltaproteobacteria bacterium]
MYIRKAVIPVAGWGTRSLPATKNIPKEMLPIYNKPVVQYVVEEAIKGGIQDVVFVSNRDKKVIEDHFDYNGQLERILEASGKTELLKAVRDVAEMVNIISVRQKRALGLGHAVLCARDIVRGDDAFAIMLGDDLMFGMNPGIGQLLEVARSENKSVIGVVEVPQEEVKRYGIISGTEQAPGVFKVNSLVEKPEVSKAPSRMAIIGRYVLTPHIFDHLEKTGPGKGGEIQLTDALQGLADNQGLLAVKIRGMRFDAGNWAEYLTANIYFALQDPDLHDELVQRLKPLLPYAKEAEKIELPRKVE